MIYDELVKGIAPENIFMNEAMSKHTSFKVGGIADFYNIIVKDRGFRGIIIKLDFKHLKIEKDKVVAGAGVPVALLSEFTYRKGISGFEFLAGIPGTVGGAVKMNAGAFGGEIRDILLETTIIDEKYNLKKLDNQSHNFSYRNSIFFEKKWIIVGSSFKIEKGSIDEIKEKRKSFMQTRREKQPIEFPNAGSIFKRGEDCIPAKLIDDAGFKGYSIGGAQISEKHAGFIVNKGNATSTDIIKLIKYTKEIIKEKYGIELQQEVIVL